MAEYNPQDWDMDLSYNHHIPGGPKVSEQLIAQALGSSILNMIRCHKSGIDQGITDENFASCISVEGPGQFGIGFAHPKTLDFFKVTVCIEMFGEEG